MARRGRGLGRISRCREMRATLVDNQRRGRGDGWKRGSRGGDMGRRIRMSESGRKGWARRGGGKQGDGRVAKDQSLGRRLRSKRTKVIIIETRFIELDVKRNKNSTSGRIKTAISFGVSVVAYENVGKRPRGKLGFNALSDSDIHCAANNAQRVQIRARSLY